MLTCDLEATAAVPRSTFNTRSPDWFGNREPLGSEAWLTRAGSHTRPPPLPQCKRCKPRAPNARGMGTSRELPKLAVCTNVGGFAHLPPPTKGVVIADQPHYPCPPAAPAERSLPRNPEDASVCNKPMRRVIQSSMSVHWSLLYTGGVCSVWE